MPSGPGSQSNSALSVPGLDCGICRGLKFYLKDVPVGHPDFGVSIPCPDCAPVQRRKIAEGMTRLSNVMQTMTFATTVETPFNREAVSAVRSLAERPAWFLTLLGPNGRGKTHLLAALVNECAARGVPALYMTTAELLQDLQATFAPDSPVKYSQILEVAARIKVLVLDEFDRFNPTDWASTQFFTMIEMRYRRGDELLTAFASNSELADFPPYLASRMQDARCKIVRMSGPDMRQF